MNEQITVEKIRARICESLGTEPGLSSIQAKAPSLDLAGPSTGSAAQEGRRIAFKGRLDSFLWKYGMKYAKVINRIPVLKGIAKKQYYRLSFDYYARPLKSQTDRQPAQDLVDMPWSYNRFRKQASEEGLKGKIKLSIFTCLGFVASWQEQINEALFRAIDARQAASEAKLIALFKQAMAEEKEASSARLAKLTVAYNSVVETINTKLEKSLAEQQSQSDTKLRQLETAVNKSVGSIGERLEKSLAEQQSQSDTRLRQLETAVNKSVGSVGEILDQLTSISSDIPDVLVTKGQIDNDSYLAMALDNSSSSLAELKSKNKDEDVFYYLLENVFRGDVDNIKSRQSIYLPYVVEAQAKSKGKYFLDLGCGRGEFLSLLNEKDIAARGVDSNGLMKEILEQQGLEFIQSDALEYLKGLKNNFLTGLSMFQVIEHLDYKYVSTLLEVAYHKVAKSGIVILESVNPYCFMAKGGYHLDPTHITLFSPDMIKFTLEWHGFSNIKIVYSSPVSTGLRQREPIMNYQTYAVIGEKA